MDGSTRRLKESEVTPEMTGWAEQVQREHHPVGYAVRRTFGALELEARVELHTHEGATGRRFDQPQPGTSLFVVSAAGGPMRTSRAGLDFIARWEGEVLYTYLDSAGKATIGVGHLIRPGESFPATITHEHALRLLEADVQIAEKAVHALGVKLEQHAFDALVSFAFNVGTGALASSTLVRELRAGDRAGAADQFLMWDKAGGKSVPGLHNRRVAERALFLGDDVAPTPTVTSARTLDTVAGIQGALNALGAQPPLVVDGHAGDKTKAAIVAFQRAHGLTPDGVVGRLTREAIEAALSTMGKP